MLRLQPTFGIERGGRIGVIQGAKLISLAGQPADGVLTYEYDEYNPTALRLPLPKTVDPGQSVTVELVVEYTLPNKQGRLGYWEGVTYLTNSFPVLAYCDDTGWRPMPFVPWHQPWFNEAGVFRATITIPEGEYLGCPAPVKTETRLGDGFKRLETEPFIGRDFAVLCSARYKEFTAETKLPSGKTVKLRCLAFAEHEWYAREILTIVAEAIPVYSQWFGDFPYDTFTVAESYFGWNGNECAGLIMIDERVFGMPHLARGYGEYLVSHETCHQWWYNLVGTNGYSEPFMDEGSAAYFTHRLLDRKRGKNNQFMLWPRGFGWMPNIDRENYHWGGTYYAIRNGDMMPARGSAEVRHLFHLFTGVRSRVEALGMVEALGEAAFLTSREQSSRSTGGACCRSRTTAANWRRTPAATGASSSTAGFWQGLTDWKLEDVQVSEVGGPRCERGAASANHPRSNARYTASVVIRQKGQFTEPTVVSFESGESAKGETVRVPIGLPQAMEMTRRGRRSCRWAMARGRSQSRLPFVPDQVSVDPDHVLLDANPTTTMWKSSARVRVTPLTMLDETDLTSDYNRWNFTAGPWIWGPSYQDRGTRGRR